VHALLGEGTRCLAPEVSLHFEAHSGAHWYFKVCHTAGLVMLGLNSTSCSFSVLWHYMVVPIHAASASLSQIAGRK